MNSSRELGGWRSTTVEMERVAGVNGAARATVRAKCCGGGGRPNGAATGQQSSSRAPAAAAEPPPGVCQPKCPAVSGSPWDPIKTWLAIVLSVAMIVWAGLGVYFIKFRKA